MKEAFTRYAGKILAITKRDGLISGIQTVFRMFVVIFKIPMSGDILFVSSGAVGDSWRYRVKNVAEELNLHGFSAATVIQENVWMESLADRFKIFVFHRVNNTPQIAKLIEKIKKQGKEIIFETDDLLFDPEILKKQDFYANINALEKKFYENGVGGEILADSYVKTCTTTTHFLAEKLKEKGKQVFIVPNKLSKKDVEVADSVLNTRREIRSTVRIGYFSGVMGHNKDFATVTDALVHIMDKYPTVELFLAGPLEITNVLNKFRDRIIKLPYVSREKHLDNVADVDINIAPLEIGNPFCEAKSELKFFEAGILRIPTVATATDPLRRAIDDGEDGFVARSTKEWIEKLEALIIDQQLRELMGDKAREKALKNYTTERAANKEYYAFLKSRLHN